MFVFKEWSALESEIAEQGIYIFKKRCVRGYSYT